MFPFFSHKACGIIAPQPGIKPAPSALEGEVLTTGPPGKFPLFVFLIVSFDEQVINFNESQNVGTPRDLNHVALETILELIWLSHLVL